jgi:hypothetical protein
VHVSDHQVTALARELVVEERAIPGPRPPRAPRQRVEARAEHGLLRLWELHGEGASTATIAAALNREGFRAPSGHRWHGKAIARVLAEPALAVSYDEQ